jgi:hypothetical protein
LLPDRIEKRKIIELGKKNGNAVTRNRKSLLSQLKIKILGRKYHHLFCLIVVDLVFEFSDYICIISNISKNFVFILVFHSIKDVSCIIVADLNL